MERQVYVHVPILFELNTANHGDRIHWNRLIFMHQRAVSGCKWRIRRRRSALYFWRFAWFWEVYVMPGLGPRMACHLRSLTNAAIDPTTRSRVRVGPHVCSVSPQSFWQSHRDAPEVLSEAVLAGAQAGPGDHVVDLFSGVGLFAAALARAVGPRGRVSAVESSPDAVADARVNLDAMGAVRVRAWSVTPRAVNDAVGEGDVVVLDPPRTGLARGVAAALAHRRPRRIVYVSCDAATFARDLKNFLDGGYAVRDLRVLDLFPMTEHVELVTTLDIAP